MLPKDDNRPGLDKVMLGQLIDLISDIGLGVQAETARDLLGHVCQCFRGGFAGSEGKRGGEFDTPRAVVRVLLEMLEPNKGRVYAPCCGAGRYYAAPARIAWAQKSSLFTSAHFRWHGNKAVSHHTR